MREENDYSAFEHLDDEVISRYLACEAESENKLPSSNIPEVWNALSTKLVLSDPATPAHRQSAESGEFSSYTLSGDTLKQGYFSLRGLPRWVGYSTLAAVLLILAYPSIGKYVTSSGETITRDYTTRR